MHHPLTHLKILVQNWVYKTSWLYQFNNLYFGSLYFVFSKCIFLCWPRPSSDWWWTRYTSRRWLPLDRWCLLYRKILNLTSAIKYDSVFWEGCSQLCFYLVLQNCLDFLSQIKSQFINRKIALDDFMWYPTSPCSYEGWWFLISFQKKQKVSHLEKSYVRKKVSHDIITHFLDFRFNLR